MSKRKIGSLSQARRNLLKQIPGYDPFESAGDCVFDEEAARLVLDFFPQLLKHVKGAKANTPFILEPWQQSILANLFGWKRPDGTRRYRESFVLVPRKNGKTAMAGGLVLFMLVADGEAGAEIYSAAADRDQASLVYQQAKGMVIAEPELSRRLKVYQTFKSIVYEETNSSYKAISAEADTKHGYNTHCAVVDELHAQKNRDLVDVLLTSTGSRRQPLVLHITTSDYDRESICNEKYDYAAKVRDGLIDDPSFLPVIYEASKEEDWTDPKIWGKANPNLGVSVSREYLERECKRAQETPSFENTFKRLHLNIRTEQDVRWIQLDKWDACSRAVDESELREVPCFAGLDLSTTKDITAFVLIFNVKSTYHVLPYFWIPEARAHERERRDRVPYLTWARQGLIRMTPGDAVDYDVIRRDINEIGDEFNIKEIQSDPWNADQLLLQLAGDGFHVEKMRQGFASLSAPTKELEKIVLRGELRHGGNPVLRWMASNVSVEEDAAGNIKPSKNKSTEKIDGIIALVEAIAGAIRDERSDSVLEQSGRGVFWL